MLLFEKDENDRLIKNEIDIEDELNKDIFFEKVGENIVRIFRRHKKTNQDIVNSANKIVQNLDKILQNDKLVIQYVQQNFSRIGKVAEHNQELQGYVQQLLKDNNGKNSFISVQSQSIDFPFTQQYQVYLSIEETKENIELCKKIIESMKGHYKGIAAKELKKG